MLGDGDVVRSLVFKHHPTRRDSRGFHQADAAVREAIEGNPQCHHQIGNMIKHAREMDDVELAFEIRPRAIIQAGRAYGQPL